MLSLFIKDLIVTSKDGKETCVLLEISELNSIEKKSIAITGVSGSGKTTLLKALAGIIPPAQGEINWIEKEKHTQVSHLSRKENNEWRRKHVGFIFQDFQLLPYLNVFENVLLPLTFQHAHISLDDKARAKELLASVGILKHKQKVALLSRGEMQRVAFCRAVINTPSLLFADEPTASLDARNSATINSLLFEYVHKHACTLLVVSHDKEFAMQCEQQIKLEKGLYINQ